VVKSRREEAVERVRYSIEEYFATHRQDATIVAGPSGISDNIHVMIISDTFRNKEQVERDTPIYAHMKKHLDPTDVARVSLLLTLTSDEYHQHSEDIPDISGSFTVGV
jgi:acid stress-induced BolA-like protein IbaG/YrbA